jgi:teichoic acid transport system ATP-binding protein
MRARLLFSISTSVEPKILLIDEALAVGDFAFKKKSKARIQTMLDRAGTLLLVSHSLNEIATQCPRVLWVEGGRIRDDGPSKKVIARYERFGDSA